MKRLRRRGIIFLLVFLVASVKSETVARGKNLLSRSDELSESRSSAINSKYDISATLDEKNSTVRTTTKLVYRNYSSKTLHELVFHFTPNKIDESVSSIVFEFSLSKSFSAVDKCKHVLQVIPFINTNGKVLDDYFIVKLDKPLDPTCSVELEMNSESRIFDRYGIRHLEGCWHPKVVHLV